MRQQWVTVVMLWYKDSGKPNKRPPGIFVVRGKLDEQEQAKVAQDYARTDGVESIEFKTQILQERHEL